MKTIAAILYELGKPLEIEELVIPALTEGQVLVKVAYSGVCRSQLMEVCGYRGHDRYLPHLLGHEGAGQVVDIGKGVNKVNIGDRVVLTWIKGSGADSGGARYHKNGFTVNSGPVTTFCTYSIVSENRCVKIGSDFPLDVASLLGCAIPTGAGIVLNSVKPREQDSIAIWGVGGVGLSALIGAVMSGCSRIVAIDVDDTKLALASRFGATDVINSMKEDARKRINDMTGGVGFDYCVDASGVATVIENAFNSVRKRGGLCIFASHPPYGEKINLDPYDLICGKQIKGSWGGDSYPDRDIPRYVEFYRQGKLPVEKMVVHKYRLDQINEALNKLEVGCVGRVLLNVS